MAKLSEPAATRRRVVGGAGRTKTLGVTKGQLQKAVDKVGNSAAAVRKELAA